MKPVHAYLRPLVAFDVDDTLVDGDENPKEDVVRLFLLLQKFGCRMVVWTTGGGKFDQPCMAYAERIAQKLLFERPFGDKYLALLTLDCTRLTVMVCQNRTVGDFLKEAYLQEKV